MDIITPMLLTISFIMITTIFNKIKIMVKSYLDTEMKKSLAMTTVKYVQQVYSDLSGAERLELAMINLKALLREKNIEVLELEIEMLLEEVVNDINN